MSRTALQKRLALARPIFDPSSQMTVDHTWWPERGITANLTVNIGME